VTPAVTVAMVDEEEGSSKKEAKRLKCVEQ
jgi:hypothetical protein